MDGARLNFSHGTHDQHRARAEAVRAAADDAGRPLALVADLQGPKLRLGDLPAPRTLTRGEEVVDRRRRRSARDGELPVSPAVIGEVLAPGNDVLIDDGLVRLRVEEVEGGSARCTVVVGGVGQLAQGRQPARRAAADPLADAEGRRRPRARALARRRLRRALVRPLGRRRPRPAPR